MKRILLTLTAATLLVTGCQKQENIKPYAQVAVMGEEVIGSKATIVASNKKNADNSLELDYDLVIKEVSPNTFKVKVKEKGTIGKLHIVAGHVQGIVQRVRITRPKTEGAAPLDITLTSTGQNGDVFEFPQFKYDGDLDFELVDVTFSLQIKSGDLVIKNSSTISLGGSDITVKGGNVDFKPGSDFTIKPHTVVIFGSDAETELGFAIQYKAKDNEVLLIDNAPFFVLPTGHTEEQNPKVSKVTFPKGEDGSKVMRITVTGDPAQNITSVLYVPKAIPDPKNPGSMIQPEAIEFEKSIDNKKIGWACYDHCLEKEGGEATLCGYTSHFKPSDFNTFGEGWARITLMSKL